MAKQIRYFRELPPHLEAKYGKEKAEIILSKALKRYGELIQENNDEPKKALPFLRSFGEATRQKAAKLLHVISCLPGVPDLVWKRMDGIAERMSNGYETRHVTVTPHKVEIDVVRCPIYESAKVLNAPEAAQFFCSMDHLYLTKMKGLH